MREQIAKSIGVIGLTTVVVASIRANFFGIAVGVLVLAISLWLKSKV